MKIRRERTHQSGLTNIDFRTKGELDKADHFNPSLKFADFGTMKRSQYKRNPSATTFKEQVAQSAGWMHSKYRATDVFKNARYETSSNFYFGNAKKTKLPERMANFREGQLENTRWSDKLFTGDSVKNIAVKTHAARDKDIEVNESPGKKGRKRTVDEMVATRLFPKLTDPNKPHEGTLHNKIDLLRVQDARRAFRRKYADRNTIDKIFDRYDRGSKGFIDAKDLTKQANAIGIGITLDEAQVLIQTAKPSDNKGDGKLSIEEYANFIFSQNENLDVDLKQLKPTTVENFPASTGSMRSF